MNQKHPENVENFRCPGSIITNYAKCTHDIRYIIVVAKAAFKRHETIHQRTRIKFKEETNEVLIWSVALCGVETGTRRKMDQK